MTILQEHNQEAPYSFSIFSSDNDEIITCRTNVQQYLKPGPSNCAFTLNGCCLVLPSHSALYCILYCHINSTSISPECQFRFSKKQAQRKLQKQQLKQARFNFLEAKQEKWIFEDDLVDLTLSNSKIHYNSIHSENHNFEQMQTNHHVLNDSPHEQ